MIEVECPACEQLFAIEDSQLGTTVGCPHCQQPVDMSGALEDEVDDIPVVGLPKKRIVIQKGGGTFQAPGPVNVQMQPVQQMPPVQHAPVGAHPSGVVRQPMPPQPGGPAPYPPQQRAPMKVVVTDIKMPLGSMVVFMLKLMVASIPAMLIMWLVVGLLSLLFGGIITAIVAAATAGAGG
ncbi:MAG: hypothetical protein ACI9QL_000333 [Candidatus Omnitrophota bacterium]|jgi:hypothetical protein